MIRIVKKIMHLLDRFIALVCGIFPKKLQELIVRFHRLLTYACFGCINTVIDFGLYSLLYYVVKAPISIAQIVGLICGSSNGYMLNSNITFEEGKGRTKGQYFQYVGLDIFLAFFTGAFMDWAEDRIDMPMILLKVCVTAVVTVIHYIVYKKVVFRIKKEEQP